MSSPKQQLTLRHLKPRSKPLPSHPGILSVQVCKRHSAMPGSQFQLETEFAVGPGVTVIVGHSGAGKTTILRCIGGLCEPEEGRIAVGERLLFDSKQRINIESARRQVGLVF